MHRTIAFALLALIMGGCVDKETDTETDTDADTDVADQLTHRGGCADLALYAWSDADDLALHATGQGLVQAAVDAGGSKTWELTLPDSTLSLVLQSGENLSIETCNDIIDDEQRPSVSQSWSPVSGTATLAITGAAEADYELEGSATLSLEDVELEDGAGSTRTLQSYEITSAVGWLPG